MMPTIRGFSVMPLLPVSFCLMAGIAVGHWWQPDFPLLPLLVATLIVAFACHRRALLQTLVIAVCCVILGMALSQRQPDDGVSVAGQELSAVVLSEPAERPKTIGVDVLAFGCGQDGCSIPSFRNGRILRCYIAKDERSRTLGLGDEIVLTVRPPRGNSHTQPSRPHGRAGSASFFFVGSRDWHPGGTALSQLSRWQRLRLWFLCKRHVLLQKYHEMNAAKEEYAVLAAMTLGDKSGQMKELRDTYSVSGASHILAISGLHVGIVYMLLTWFMLGRRRSWLLQVVLVAAIWAFALLTGLSASVTRAATMISVYAVFSGRGGRASGLNILCFAAIVMLVADAGTLFDVSFQLSFAAVFAILLFMPLLQSLCQPQNRVLRWVWNIMLVSTCAQMGTAPLVAYYFGRLPVYFLLTNLFVIPAATVILFGSLLSLVFPLAGVALLWVVRLMNGLLRLIASLPGASIDGLRPTPLQVALTYVLFLLCYGILRLWPRHRRSV